MFVTDDKIDALSTDIAENCWEVTSFSTVGQILPHVIDAMADEGLPNRKSLAIVIAKMTLAKWHESIVQTKAAIAEEIAEEEANNG